MNIPIKRYAGSILFNILYLHIKFATGKLFIKIDEKNSIHMKGPVSKIDTINVKL